MVALFNLGFVFGELTGDNNYRTATRWAYLPILESVGDDTIGLFPTACTLSRFEWVDDRLRLLWRYPFPEVIKI
tara:strand:+ start:13759 stop:13980 length:222 start_codon:yes stop_codon:yes gene_type:complete